MCKQMHTIMTKALSTKKSPETYNRNWRQMVYGKFSKGLPPLSIPKLIKKAQDKKDEI